MLRRYGPSSPHSKEAEEILPWSFCWEASLEPIIRDHLTMRAISMTCLGKRLLKAKDSDDLGFGLGSSGNMMKPKEGSGVRASSPRNFESGRAWKSMMQPFYGIGRGYQLGRDEPNSSTMELVRASLAPSLRGLVIFDKREMIPCIEEKQGGDIGCREREDLGEK